MAVVMLSVVPPSFRAKRSEVEESQALIMRFLDKLEMTWELRMTKGNDLRLLNYSLVNCKLLNCKLQ